MPVSELYREAEPPIESPLWRYVVLVNMWGQRVSGGWYSVIYYVSFLPVLSVVVETGIHQQKLLKQALTNRALLTN